MQSSCAAVAAPQLHRERRGEQILWQTGHVVCASTTRARARSGARPPQSAGGKKRVAVGGAEHQRGQLEVGARARLTASDIENGHTSPDCTTTRRRPLRTARGAP